MSTLLPDVMSWELTGPYLLMALVLGYVIGSVPSGVIVARLMNLGDLRAIGSGNIGATNVLRTGNKAAAALTLLFDMGKGVAAVVVFTMLYGDLMGQVAGFGAMIGHCFPVWLRFRGGKGVATFLGVMLGFSLFAGLLCCVTWLVVAAVFRMSSLSALLMALCAPVWLWVLGDVSPIWVVVPLVLLIWVRHHENIGRILRGEESRIGGSKS
ncbi:MAG: glycerol-3-phosphate 1-O-acyltransferase PlsY [Pikeienuella sp.]